MDCFKKERDPQKQGHLWLEETIEKENERQNREQLSTNKKLILPLKEDGSLYRIEQAEGKQRLVVLLVLNTLKKWVEATNVSQNCRSNIFEPLRLTIRGMAGTGKSFLLHLLSTIVREIFQSNAVDIKVAPTGTAAFNINGETCHSAFGIRVNDKAKELSKQKQKKMIDKFQKTLIVMVDERSLLSSEVLGGMETNASKTVHGGGHFEEDWGGIPIVIIIGDDRQLPPVQIKGRGRGAFQILQKATKKQNKTTVEANGDMKFLDLSRKVVTLDKNQRVSDANPEFKGILERLRLDIQTEDDANRILQLDINKLSHEKQKEIFDSPETLHLFAFKKDRDELNYSSLSKICETTNPVAIIKSQVTTTFKNKHAHFKDSNLPRICTICCGCKVALKGKNILPRLGLFNGSIGSVDEIVYEEGKNPNAGDMPLYVAVNFPSYSGEAWDQNNPTIVPIPVQSVMCDKKCCRIDYLPLEIAFGKTIHTYQGLQAGRTPKGRPDNPIKTLIVNPGNVNFESNNPGLLYTTISRATTIGEDGGDSSIFFQQLTKQHYLSSANKVKENKLTKGMESRNRWIAHLEKNEVKRNFTEKEEQQLIEWSKSKISAKTLLKCLENDEWRKKM